MILSGITCDTIHSNSGCASRSSCAMFATATFIRRFFGLPLRCGVLPGVVAGPTDAVSSDSNDDFAETLDTSLMFSSFSFLRLLGDSCKEVINC